MQRCRGDREMGRWGDGEMGRWGDKLLETSFICRGGFHNYRFLLALMSLNPPCLNEMMNSRINDQ